MNKICKVCGHAGENVWRDGKYYCASCGSEIDVTQTENATSNQNGTAVGIQAVCPICKNANNNYLQDGQCHCSMCGSTFNMQQSSMNVNPMGYSSNNPMIAARKAELEKQKNNRMVWGIVFVFLFWPVAIYHFYKLYQITQEISKL